jgi:hypothetical protein
MDESVLEFKKAIDFFNEKHNKYYQEQLPQILDVRSISVPY